MLSILLLLSHSPIVVPLSLTAILFAPPVVSVDDGDHYHDYDDGHDHDHRCYRDYNDDDHYHHQ